MEYTTAVALTTALVQMIKTTVSLDTRYVPVVSFLVGSLLGYFLGMEDLAMVLSVGLAASGFYDMAKEPTRSVMNRLK